MPLRLLKDCALEPTSIIVELTEQDPLSEHMAALGGAFACLRDYGMRIALDDYGVGNSNLQLWAEMQPDLVKIDRYFPWHRPGRPKQNMVRAHPQGRPAPGHRHRGRRHQRRPRTWPWCASWTSATPRAGCWAAPKRRC